MLTEDRGFWLEDVCKKINRLVDGRIPGKEAGGGKAVEAEDEAVPGLADVERGHAEDIIFRGPARGVSTPVNVEAGLVDVKGVDDERGAGEMAGGTDDFRGVPAVLVHDAGGVVDVLDSVLGLNVFEDCRCRHALASSQLRHDIGFNVLIMGGGAGQDEVWGDAGFVLADTFEDAFALLRRGGAVGVGGIAEGDDRIEMGCGGIVRGDGEIDTRREQRDGEDNREEVKENSGEELHGIRVSGSGSRAGAADLYKDG